MGCCHASPHSESPLEVTAEESSFCSNEYMLQYHNSQAAHIIATIKSNSQGGLINIRQFNLIAMELRLNSQDLDSLDSNIYVFYRNFKEGKMYSASKLGVLGVILGQGSMKEKIKAVWEIVPGVNGDSANVAAMRWLVDTLFTVAGEYLPILTKGSPEESSKYMTPEVVNQYIGHFKQAKTKAISVTLNLIMNGREHISVEDLSNAISNDAKLKNLLRSDGIRSFLTELSPVPVVPS